MTQIPLLSLLTWLPALGALLVLVIREPGSQRMLALAASLASLLAAIAMLVGFNPTQPGFQLVEQIGWVPSWGLSYALAVDGINLWLVVLTTVMMPFAINATASEQGRGTQYSLLLLLETAILGAFLAQDLLLFYVFFEFTLVPTALLLGIWGGSERIRAATTFFLYTFAGSVFLLLAIIGVYLAHSGATGTNSFNYATLATALRGPGAAVQLGVFNERLLFFGFLIAFAVKIALWPFHTWMPLLHGQTPRDGSVDVGAVLLKVLGGYGMIRFTLGLFPAAAQWAAPAIGVLAVIGILYGAWVAYHQNDIKRLLAYSSVSHLGLVVLGIYALNQIGISGAILQLVNYGLTTGALFLAVALLEDRVGTRQIREIGGLWAIMPVFGSIVLVLVLASIGLPGLNGFIGEFTVFQGTWLSVGLGWRYVLVAVVGVILAAVYMLAMYRRVFMGRVRPEHSNVSDIQGVAIAPLAVLLVPVVVIGLFPTLILGPLQPVAEQLASNLAAALAAR